MTDPLDGWRADFLARCAELDAARAALAEEEDAREAARIERLDAYGRTEWFMERPDRDRDFFQDVRWRDSAFTGRRERTVAYERCKS